MGDSLSHLESLALTYLRGLNFNRGVGDYRVYQIIIT